MFFVIAKGPVKCPEWWLDLTNNSIKLRPETCRLAKLADG
jgi:hypothetical protein